MSARYECGSARETPVSILAGQDALEASTDGVLTEDEVRRGEIALIIGDPWASAYALTGTPGELREFIAKLAAYIGSYTDTQLAELRKFAENVIGCEPGEDDDPSSADQETLAGLADDARRVLGRGREPATYILPGAPPPPADEDSDEYFEWARRYVEVADDDPAANYQDGPCGDA
jgi:hypothetical protein